MNQKPKFKHYIPEMTTTSRSTFKGGDSVYVVLVKESDNAIIPHVFSKFENAIKFANKMKSRLLDSDLKVIPTPIRTTSDV